MAFRRLFSKRLLNTTLNHTPITPSASLSSTKHLTAAKATSHPESAENGFFRRFLHRGLPELLSLPVGDKLRERLNGGDRLHLDEVLSSPPPDVGGLERGGVSVEDARKLLRMAQVEKLKVRVRDLGKASVSYWEFLSICRETCGGSESQAVEFADSLDRAGHVIVLGRSVFLRPDQVAKSMEKLIFQSIGSENENDPRREQLEEMEREKAVIDKKAEIQVRRELYCGLGFLLGQTLLFMRLTFWELSWDVMEPICFFFTSLNFALAYGFFLRTSTEPSFEGYFYRRFKTKQRKLMEAHNFDLDKYNQLRKALYPNLGYGNPYSEPHFSPFYYREEGALAHRL